MHELIAISLVESALGGEDVEMRAEPEITTERMEHNDRSRDDVAPKEVGEGVAQRLDARIHEHLHEGPVTPDQATQLGSNGHHDVAVGNVEHLARKLGRPAVRVPLAAPRAQAAVASKALKMVFSTVGAPPHEATPLSAGEHLLDLDHLNLANRVAVTELVSVPVVVKDENVSYAERMVTRGPIDS